ncbi:hypothetical protein [Streptomyces yaizuensis]|uniref:Uncharacterized protein n=1 Tax=Streptomyces yaizuensis TaxID=2989713 RepID=A0ABQ5P9J4_9ACTN|nr:hypothetical protein [Streptomyces sp. YSPA8]GLF99170.1 hypothetical protein SYYSPA8_32755 [Streptomyces sp. YSPA8]
MPRRRVGAVLALALALAPATLVTPAASASAASQPARTASPVISLCWVVNSLNYDYCCVSKEPLSYYGLHGVFAPACPAPRPDEM